MLPSTIAVVLASASAPGSGGGADLSAPPGAGNAAAKPAVDGLPITSARRSIACRTWARKRVDDNWRTTAARRASGRLSSSLSTPLRDGSSASISSHGRFAV